MKRKSSNKNKQKPVNNNPNALPVNGANVIPAGGLPTCTRCWAAPAAPGSEHCTPCQNR